MFKISNGWSWFLGFGIAIGAFGAAVSLTLVLSIDDVLAQINPDNTLPSNSSVTVDGNTSIITGGTQAGSNLFHSFKDFSVPTGGTAFFNNAQDIQNIFSRVTGGSVSNIDGLIRANGTANLFLINPNGIIFGRDASLNIGGSFLATTANSLKFADGYQFSATAPQTTPILAISVPIGLQYGSNSNSSIRVSGNGNNLVTFTFKTNVNSDHRLDPSNRPPGLHYTTQTAEKTIALVGSNVVLDGGNITLPQGRVEIWSVNSGEVSLVNRDGQLQLQPGQGINYADIELRNAASIDTSGNSAGSIQLRGKNISLSDGSVIVTDTLGSGKPGMLNVFASESLKIQGIVNRPNNKVYSGILTNVASGATGNGSNITIEAKSLFLSDRGRIQSATFGDGFAGNLSVKARDIQISGSSSLDASGIFSLVFPGATGNGGNLSIETESLQVRAGAQIQSSTLGFGTNPPAATQPTATPPPPTTTQLFDNPSPPNATTLPFANTSPSKIIVFSASGNSKGGNVNIQTRNLVVDGGQIASVTTGSGDAGNLQVEAENVELAGIRETGRSGLFANAYQGDGDGGNITVTADRLMIRDGATINVSNFQSQNQAPPGTGAAGSVLINAPFLLLKNQGIITADTNKGDFGNITIHSQNLVMRSGSTIATNAHNSSSGGNLTISTNTLVALENSDITANAQKGFGGRVVVNARGIFGIQFSEQLTSKSDITASSELGLQFNGTVELNIPEADPSQGLIALPVNLVDTSGQIDTTCLSNTSEQASSFVITGHGGLPASPYEMLRSDAVQVNWITLNSNNEDNKSPLAIGKPYPISPQQIVEAAGWIINDKGEVILTALPTAAAHDSWHKPVDCNPS
ncbi:filamentous hemagglutinin N-terminal domain-containing protein [Scytonema sp. NUACC26]|uniref:filamentous hemagglutinin N-terminal domain-containing protein n=1 Tax=Scytonema sp. NUACC26 TaxID=3140176 RepID=UPI0034DBF722